jgi:hypothetical protein
MYTHKTARPLLWYAGIAYKQHALLYRHYYLQKARALSFNFITNILRRKRNSLATIPLQCVWVGNKWPGRPDGYCIPFIVVPYFFIHKEVRVSGRKSESRRTGQNRFDHEQRTQNNLKVERQRLHHTGERYLPQR